MRFDSFVTVTGAARSIAREAARAGAGGAGGSARAVGLALLLAAASLLPGSAAGARETIRIVGSSTVYPFATTVAERFGQTTPYDTPVVESTGSGGGLKLFCAGVGEGHPDITNASRRIKPSEIERCRENGVDEVTEVKIGYDGIVLANAREAAQASFTLRQVYLALARQIPDGQGGFKPNPYRRWSEIDASLPDVRIKVYGPPPTSGTRDAFVELAMEGGCRTFSEVAELKETDKDRYKAVCHGIREDEAFVEAGENDVLIVQKLAADPDAFGIFGFSFLDQNRDRVEGSEIAGLPPTFETISDASYPVSRSLFFYVKNAHVGRIPGLEEYVAEFMGEKAIGPDGYLADKGLIPLPEEQRSTWRERAAAFEPLSQ